MKLGTIPTLFFAFFLFGAGLVWLGGAQGSDVASGVVEEGFRLLPLPGPEKEDVLTVYRGDYIRFATSGEMAGAILSIPAMTVNQSLAGANGEIPFVKMTKVGEFPFSIGEHKGLLKVIEYDRPQYVAMTPGEAAQLIANVKPLILDVRTRQEYAGARLAGAMHIPIQELQQRLGELSGRENDNILIYCATGNRSTVAAKILIDNGFNRIYNLREGLAVWARESFAVER